MVVPASEWLTFRMKRTGSRGGVSSLLEVVNRRVIAKAGYPGSRYGSLLEEIFQGVNVAFPNVRREVNGVDLRASAGGRRRSDGESRKGREGREGRGGGGVGLDGGGKKKMAPADGQEMRVERLVEKMRRLRRSRSVEEGVVEVEVEAMRRIVGSESGDKVEALARLWGLPGEVSRMKEFSDVVVGFVEVERFYRKWIEGFDNDARLWNVLAVDGIVPRKKVEDLVIGILKRKASKLYRENLQAAAEVVLYAINPDGFSKSYSVREFKEASLCKSLRDFERDGAYELALDALEPRRFSSLVEDIKVITRLQGGSLPGGAISLEALNKYFEDRELLTPRATAALVSRYGTGGRGCFTENDFVRMYLALTDCSSVIGIKYWFAVLDHDFDGAIGISDVAHFYSERRAEGEKTSAVILADVMSLWTRLCAAARSDFRGKGLRLKDLKAMNDSDREFILCALLIRRIDDTALVNVTATLALAPHKTALAVVS